MFYGDLSSPKAEILSKLASTDDYNSTSMSSQCSTTSLTPANPKIHSKYSDPSLKVYRTMSLMPTSRLGSLFSIDPSSILSMIGPVLKFSVISVMLCFCSPLKEKLVRPSARL